MPIIPGICQKKAENEKRRCKNMEDQQQKPIIVARCVSELEMLNIINDKLDYLIMKEQEEVKK